MFSGNTASKLYKPPKNADTLYPNIKYASVSPATFSHPLNNYDINYTVLLDDDNHFAYIIGYPDGNIRPNSNITRAETATIFFRLLTQESRAELWSKTSVYTDVKSDMWYNNAISSLTNGSVLTGDPDGNFRPDMNITRGELAAVAARFASAAYDGDDLFDDIGSHWAAEYINIAASLGWVEGYGDGTYHPDQYITRAEVATFVNRVLKRLPESGDDLLADMVTWPDNMDAAEWFYLAIQEATNSHYYWQKVGGIYETWTMRRGAPYWKQLEHPDSQPGDVSY